MTAPDIHLLSAGTALPGAAVDNAALARHFGMNPQWEEWIDLFIGTRTRHLSLDLATGEATGSLSDLCARAAGTALDRAGLAAGDVDLVVMGTSTPEKLMPATVNVVADRLGVDGVPTYQLQSGCTGAIQALDLARQLLLSGRHRNALIIGGDISHKFYDVAADLRALPPEELVHYVLFGDGAGAAVLSTEERPDAALVRHVFVRLVGLGRAPGQTLDWFGPADRTSDRRAVEEDYKAIEAAVPEMAEEILTELLDELGWKPVDVDHLLPPQLSGRMTAKIVERLGVPDAQEVSCVRETGNNGNATPFFQLERMLEELAPGDRAVGISIESSKWIKAGFALERA
jgi:3-oxoacyl-[acyl-carrier-protein] synthase III